MMRPDINRRVRRARGAVHRAAGRIAAARSYLVESDQGYIEVDEADGELKEVLTELAIADRALVELRMLLRLASEPEGRR